MIVNVYFFWLIFAVLLFINCKTKIRLYTHHNAFNFGWGGGVGGWGAPLIEFGDKFAPVFLLA